MNRPSLDEYMLELAAVAARRTTCVRRGVGCVLVSARGHVLAVGYNGVASGLLHCNEQTGERRAGYAYEGWLEPVFGHACKGHDLPPGQDSCGAIHAEQSALVQCADAFAVETAYVTLSPCPACTKLLLGTSCQRIVFREEHPGATGRALWEGAGRSWKHLSGLNPAPRALPGSSA